MHTKRYILVFACSILLVFITQVRGFCGLDSLRLLYSKSTSKAEQSQLLGQLAFELAKTHPDSALILSKKGLTLGTSVKSSLSIADCLNAAGWSFYTLGNNDSAVLYLDSAAHLFHRINAASPEARCLINLSCVYNRQKHYEKALGNLLHARKLLENVNDDNAKAYAELEIGIIYRQQAQYANALIYLRSSVADFKKAGSQSYVADALSSLGGLFIYLNEPDSSLACYHQMLAIHSALGNSYGIAFAYENIGDAYLKKAEHMEKIRLLDSSLQCYEKALQIFTSIHDENDARYEQFNIGKTHRRMKNYSAATKALESSFKYFDSTSSINNAYDAAQELVLLYKEKQQFPKALQYTEVVQKYKDTLDARNRSSDMAEMLARYETERKDQTIRLLNTRQLLYRQEITRGRATLIFSGALLLLGLALTYSASSRNRIRRQLREVSLRNQLARDLHDDIGSSLSSIMLLSKMGNTAFGNTGSMQHSIIERIDFTSREIMERMSDIVWSMNPKYDRFINLKEKIETHFAHMRDISEINMQVSISEDIAGMKLPMELRKNLFLIVKEAVNNALKYSQAGQFSVNMYRQADKLFMSIKDDGIGFDTGTMRPGNGMDTMMQRAVNSNGTYHITSATGMGTEITLQVRLPHIR